MPCIASPAQPYQIRHEDAINHENFNTIDDAALPKRKRKCSKYIPNQPELDFNARHDAIEPHLSLALEKLHSWMHRKDAHTLPQALGVEIQPKTTIPQLPSSSSSPPPPPPPPLDFIALGAVRKIIKPKLSWTSSTDEPFSTKEVEEEFEESLDVFDTLIKNESNVEKKAVVFDQNYFLIPPQSSFLLSDLKIGLRLNPLLEKYHKNKFQCIVIDPPWENRSVKRSATTATSSPSSTSSYQMLPNRTLHSLPVSDLAAPGCLVALWVTNREKLRKFVENELLSTWKLRHVATWHWLKVAQDGRPVTPLDAAHRRPYESLLLCYRIDDSETEREQQFYVEERKKNLPPLPDNMVIVSVPTEHSRKPFLGNLLQRYVEPYEGGLTCCLEMFARGMHRGWVSWGNEVLKFQALEHFIATSSAEEEDGGAGE